MRNHYLNFFFFIIFFVITSQSNIQKNNNTSQKYLNRINRNQKNSKCIFGRCNDSIIGFTFLGMIFTFFLFCIIATIYENYKRRRLISSNIEKKQEYDENNEEEKSNNSNENEVIKIPNIVHNNLISKIYTEDMIKSGEECVICLKKFILNKIKVCLIPCNHIFHFSCIKDYIILSDDYHCPICGFDFSSYIRKKIDFNDINTQHNNNEFIIHDIKIENTLNVKIY